MTCPMGVASASMTVHSVLGVMTMFFTRSTRRIFLRAPDGKREFTCEMCVWDPSYRTLEPGGAFDPAPMPVSQPAWQEAPYPITAFANGVYGASRRLRQGFEGDSGMDMPSCQKQ